MGAFLPKLGLAAIAALAISGTANAAVTITSFTAGPGSLGVPVGQTLLDNFDGGVAPGFSVNLGSVGQIVSGTQALTYQAPLGDATQYLAVLRDPTATASVTLPANTSAISFYVGSIDSYNTITFVSNAGPAFNTVFLGSQLLSAAGASTDGRFLFDLSTSNIGSITFNSTQNAMEIDNFAGVVPEPGVWAMMVLGMGGLGYALRRRRFAVSGAATA